ncbi:PREDICTED: uncharacterized protein LOC109116391 [Tarenaya hassleriana]|uniref:uncharacterized protein LOC109116391 n=1 Tax=Tarenaya hassleriana TaxID=28532 RepID=UPI0008FD50CE|nr:PREDICTED: uncharacterized protein LOC109116391 [Tarenaya hassleriana]
MTDLDKMEYFLVMEIKQSSDRVLLSQGSYAKKLLEKFKMSDYKPVNIPLEPNGKNIDMEEEKEADAKEYRSMVGSLLYLKATRPDLMFAASYLSRFMSKPEMPHFKQAKRGYCDSDWVGNQEDMKSTSGYVFKIGGVIFSWQIQKQEVIAQSTMEAKYISAAVVVNQTIWLRNLLDNLGCKQEGSTPIFL